MAFEISKEKLESLSVKECLSEGFELFKENFVGIFIAFILTLVCSVLTLGVLFGSLYPGLVEYLVKLKNKEEDAKPTDIFSKLNILLPALLAVIAIVVLAMLNKIILGGIFGGFVSMLTGIIVSSIGITVTTLGLPLLANNKLTSAIETLEFSWNTFLKSPKTFFFLAIASHVLSLLGVLLFGIGILLTAPLGACMLAVAYYKLVDRDL